VVWWLLREIGPQRMPKIFAVEKSKHQLSVC
jgi:hypothetical protein